MELHTLETSLLMDLLAKYTIEFTKMLNDGTGQEEYLKCKEAIKAIQSEIELRQNGGAVSTNSNNNMPDL